MEIQEPTATGGQLGSPLIATQQTMYTIYMAMKLWDLSKQCKLHLGEYVPAWLLQLVG